LRKPFLRERVTEGLSVRDDLVGVRRETRQAASLNATAFAAIDVFEWSALLTGKDGGVDLLGVLLTTDDRSPARTAKRLVRREGDHVGVGHRIRMRAAGDQSRRRGPSRTSTTLRLSSAISRKGTGIDESGE
jgi:hypothetical protein